MLTIPVAMPAINKVSYVSSNSLTIGTEDVFGVAGNISSIDLTFNASKTIGTGQGMVVFNDSTGGNNGKFALYSDNGSFVPTLGTITVFENSVFVLYGSGLGWRQ